MPEESISFHTHNAGRNNDARKEYQTVYNPTYSYQNQITSKIQNILHGKKSISLKKLLKNNPDIAAIYNRLSDEGKNLVEFVISQDGNKKNVTERELRNLYRLMDMNGGNVDCSFYNNDITEIGSGKMIEDLARDTSGKVQNNLRTAHRLTKTTEELGTAQNNEQMKKLDIKY